MTEIHPLRRKSVKPSISTVRGMLPGKQFRSLDSAMQSLRTAGLRLEWRWVNPKTGWVCVGLADDKVACELHPVEEPLIGIIQLKKKEIDKVKKGEFFPKKYCKILELPINEARGTNTYEFPLEESKFRDLFTAFVEAVEIALNEPA